MGVGPKAWPFINHSIFSGWGWTGKRGKGRKGAETEANMDETPAEYFSIHSLLPCYVPPPSIEELNMYFFEYRKKLIAYK